MRMQGAQPQDVLFWRASRLTCLGPIVHPFAGSDMPEPLQFQSVPLEASLPFPEDLNRAR